MLNSMATIATLECADRKRHYRCHLEDLILVPRDAANLEEPREIRLRRLEESLTGEPVVRSPGQMIEDNDRALEKSKMA